MTFKQHKKQIWLDRRDKAGERNRTGCKIAICNNCLSLSSHLVQTPTKALCEQSRHKDMRAERFQLSL